jgi:hypothetical protein
LVPDEGWHHPDRTSTMMHANKLFQRLGIGNDDSLEGSGADWVDRLKPYMHQRHRHSSWHGAPSLEPFLTR